MEILKIFKALINLKSKRKNNHQKINLTDPTRIFHSKKY